MQEIFKPIIVFDTNGNIIEDYTSHYTVSNYGRVFSVKNNYYLKIGLTKDKRYSVRLYKYGKSKLYLVHRLILFAFKGAPEKGQECRHLDGNSQNNYIDNLKWGTPKENQEDKSKHGTDNKGERCGSAILTEQDVIEIRRLYWEEDYSNGSLSSIYNIAPSHVTNIIECKIWSHIKNTFKNNKKIKGITDEDIKEMKRLKQEGYRQKDIGYIFKIDQSQVSRYIRGKRKSRNNLKYAEF